MLLLVGVSDSSDKACLWQPHLTTQHVAEQARVYISVCTCLRKYLVCLCGTVYVCIKCVYVCVCMYEALHGRACLPCAYGLSASCTLSSGDVWLGS